ncbi:VanZ family protein [Knoellia koreensis]|uniref:VanZ family protein n=1 Tax=Knoellia koreensis TaxID=2730921 RepID=A0A849HAQ6_9MICO|nr:VanZ family protein [Knoellia sp. DB2414S]NNM44442.1 VanZ family protein [Knoellia sp. DB2414S]
MTGGFVLDAQSWTSTVTGVVALTVAVLPLALLAVCALAGGRIGSGVRARVAWRRSFAEVALVYGTVPGVWLTMLPGGPAEYAAVSLEPLRDLATMSTFQVVGNLLLLAALGFFAPVRFAGLATFPRVVLLAGAVSTLIEVMQHVLELGRVSSVDDILLNTAGATIAATLSWPWWARRRRPIPEPRPLAPLARR